MPKFRTRFVSAAFLAKTLPKVWIFVFRCSEGQKIAKFWHVWGDEVVQKAMSGQCTG